MARKSPQPLSRPQVAAAALALIDAQGLAALSMRKLGAALGVEAMSLYRHVRNREDLLDAVHAHLLAQVQVPAQTEDWVEDAMAFAWALRAGLMRHPNAVPLVVTRVASEGPALRLLEAALVCVNRGVDEPSEAIAVVQTLFVFVAGHCGFFAAAAARDVDVDPQAYPSLARTQSLSAEDEFGVGLGIIAAGLRARGW